MAKVHFSDKLVLSTSDTVDQIKHELVRSTTGWVRVTTEDGKPADFNSKLTLVVTDG
jgi:hypothetical protein